MAHEIDNLRQAWQRIVRDGLTVREAEALAKGKRPLERPARPRHRPDAETAALEEQLRSALGTKVEIRKGRKGGRLTVHFFSDEEFESIVERLLGV